MHRDKGHVHMGDRSDARLVPGSAERAAHPCGTAEASLHGNERGEKGKSRHRGLMEGLTAHSARVKHVKMLNKLFLPLPSPKLSSARLPGALPASPPCSCPPESTLGALTAGGGKGESTSGDSISTGIMDKGFCLPGRSRDLLLFVLRAEGMTAAPL